ncbi:uncharacterized protein [Solanum lycopersicum]|uniref:uncharacterized protein n=1 Tax=Solanum lycopersicum TaxID=4081 RepID=UPI003747A316
MGSVSHIDEAKKDVVNDFHRFARLSVRLENSPNGSIMVNYDSKSYVVVELKPNKLLHQPLMELKESVLGLRQTQKQYDSIWVVVDRLTESPHFIPVKSTYSVEDRAKIFIAEIGNWEKHLHLMEFAYNNSNSLSISMAHYEALYYRRCRSPIEWFEVGESSLLDPYLIYKTLKKVHIIWNLLKTAYIRKNSCANHRTKELEFEEGDKVYLKIIPMKGVVRFGNNGKLSPPYVGPYEILQRVGKVSYELQLPRELYLVHLVFHFSMLKQCNSDPESILPVEGLGVKDNLSYEEVPVKIIDREVRNLMNKEVPSIKMLWKNHLLEDMGGRGQHELPLPSYM